MKSSGRGNGFSWAIILAKRQNFNSDLIEDTGFVSVEDGFADVWVSEKDYLEWRKQQTANDVYLARELPKAKQRRDQEIITAKNSGATKKQIGRDFASRYDAQVFERLPFKQIVDSRVARIQLNNAIISLANEEAEKMKTQRKLEAVFPLISPSHIVNGFQGALKISLETEICGSNS